MFTVFHGKVQEFPPSCNERQIETAILNMLARADLAIGQCLLDDYAHHYIILELPFEQLCLCQIVL